MPQNRNPSKLIQSISTSHAIQIVHLDYHLQKKNFKIPANFYRELRVNATAVCSLCFYVAKNNGCGYIGIQNLSNYLFEFIIRRWKKGNYEKISHSWRLRLVGFETKVCIKSFYNLSCFFYALFSIFEFFKTSRYAYFISRRIKISKRCWHLEIQTRFWNWWSNF